VNIESLLTWLSESEPPKLSEQDAIDAYISMHPKTLFFKTLPMKASVLDIAPSDRGLAALKDWLAFPRPDLRICGASATENPHADAYETWLEFDTLSYERIEKSLEQLVTKLSAVVITKLIERIDQPEKVLGLLAQRLSKGGRMYVEWPSPHSRLLPKLAEIQAHGYPISTLNFYDDAAHQSTYSIDWMLKHTQRLGFRCEQRGELSLPFLAEQLRDHGVRSKDSFLLSSALWLRTRYVSFASFEKIV